HLRPKKQFHNGTKKGHPKEKRKEAEIFFDLWELCAIIKLYPSVLIFLQTSTVRPPCVGAALLEG
ncbi:MAG: hypothetical protein RSC08_03865, partial [Oscillospiraceae bacterium]